MPIASLTEPFRDAAWLTAARARAYCAILAIASVTLAAAGIALSTHGLDPTGKPLGTDFLSFWAASKLALAGTPAATYDIAAHYAAQRAVFDGAAIGFAAFFYPPVFLLICLPLAVAPYFVSLCLWLLTTFYAYWRVIGGLFDDKRGLWLIVLAFPAVLINIGHGQNGFLTAALFGGGVLAAQKRPILSGVLFGCLIFKPHLAVLIPVALAARGAWRTFFATGATAAGLIALSAMVFGRETWEAFQAVSPLARQTLEQALVEPEKMQSVFAAMRILGGSVDFAYLAQGIVALAAGLLLVIFARSARAAGSEAQGAALAAGALLATPFLLDYDLTLLAIPLAWLFNAARRTGFLPWEKGILFAAFVLPLVSRLVALRFGIPLGPPVIAALLLMVLRRGLLDTKPQAWSRAAPDGAPLHQGGRP